MISQNITRSRTSRTCERTSYQRLIMKRSYIILMTAVMHGRSSAKMIQCKIYGTRCLFSF